MIEAAILINLIGGQVDLVLFSGIKNLRWIYTSFTEMGYKKNELRWPSGKSVHLGSCRLGFDSESGQTNDFKIGIYSFPA